jgi:hypothetical protein
MKRLFAGLCVLALLFMILFQSLAQAQTAPEARTVEPLSKEVTLTGTVSSVLMEPAAGMIPGSHLLLATASGLVDASLGRFGLRGKGGLSVAAGQVVEVTGVMRTIKDKPVFMTRTVKVGDQVYTIRNEHGVPVSPQARERAQQKGESL